MRGPISAEHLSKREIDQMAREMAKGSGRPMTEAEKRQKAEEIHRMFFGNAGPGAKGTV